MSMPTLHYYTAEMVRNFPDDGSRYETVHGELLVTPAPRIRHQAILRELMVTLGVYLRAEQVGGLFSSPADISWASDTLVQPDLFVADPDELRRAQDWSGIQTLHLVVEILSPSSLRADRFTKRRLYQEQHVATYWIVDTDHRQVEIWTPEALSPVVERERLAWQHPAMTTACTVELAALFNA
jgi:Uma2 family endonuclease